MNRIKLCALCALVLCLIGCKQKQTIEQAKQNSEQTFIAGYAMMCYNVYDENKLISIVPVTGERVAFNTKTFNVCFMDNDGNTQTETINVQYIDSTMTIWGADSSKYISTWRYKFGDDGFYHTDTIIMH